jgi:hypothetical protein
LAVLRQQIVDRLDRRIRCDHQALIFPVSRASGCTRSSVTGDLLIAIAPIMPSTVPWRMTLATQALIAQR